MVFRRVVDFFVGEVGLVLVRFRGFCLGRFSVRFRVRFFFFFSKEL